MKLTATSRSRGFAHPTSIGSCHFIDAVQPPVHRLTSFKESPQTPDHRRYQARRRFFPPHHRAGRIRVVPTDELKKKQPRFT